MDLMAIKPLVIYRKACPNCGGDITSDRLLLGLPCHKCLPEVPREVKSPLEVLALLERLGKLYGFKYVRDLTKEYDEFAELFQKVVGTKMWGAQRLWARRLIKGKSFAIVAPTGSGKTTFGIVAALYTVLRRKGRVLIVVPTSTLAYDVYRRFLTYIDRIKANVKVVLVSSILPPKERAEAKKAVESGDFDVLIVTNAYLPRGIEVLKKYKFSLIFVDDVDSVLKASSKNIDRLLILLGVSEDALRKALNLVDLAKKLQRAIRLGMEDEAARLREEVRRLSEELREYVRQANLGVLIASGAIAKMRRTTRLLLFREFLGFEAGGRAEGIRNVVDAYLKPKRPLIEEAVNLVKRLGGGGIIYVPPDLKDLIDELVKRLNEEGIKAEAYLKPSRTLLNDFVEGRIDVLIGLATARSALVRGIDLPQRITYVVFLGVPRMKFRLRLDEFTPARYMMFLFNVRNVVPQELRPTIDRAIARLRNISGMSQEQLNNILKAVEEGKELSGFEKYVADTIKESIELAKRLLDDPKIREAIQKSSDVNLEYKDGELYVVVSDSTTYIQGSGRTSRLYIGGVSKGLSVVIVDDERVFNGLQKNLRYRIEDLKFVNLEDLNLDELMAEIRQEREVIKEILAGKLPPKYLEKDMLRTALLVVESPTKARTIARFFGVPARRDIGPLTIYEVTLGDLYLLVTATRGHTWDLVPQAPPEALEYCKYFGVDKMTDYYGVLKVEKEGREIFIPIYNTIKRCPVGGENYTEDVEACRIHNVKLIDARNVVDAIREIATEVDQVLIGTDPDAEGEKIAWDVFMMLRPYVRDISRIEFHEVTKKAILDAIANTRSVNVNMVCAQLVRRIEDRWIGFGLSQLVQERFGKKTLSAGRVQTPVLGWIIQRYEESRREKVYNVVLTLENGIRLRLGIPLERQELVRVLRMIKQGRTPGVEVKVKVERIGEELIDVNPPPPYTTDALLKDAANILGLSVEAAMAIAQELFEAGLITYHRTDSTRVSTVGIALAREYITAKYGADLFVGRTWMGKELGAHECIRPTRPIDVDELRNLVNTGLLQLAIRLTPNHYRIYDLIFRRFMASQMRGAKAIKERLKISLIVGNAEAHSEIVERISNIIEPGFTLVWPYVEGMEYRELQPGIYTIKSIEQLRRVSKVPPLREGDVIAMMKERGIGRPSTYAKIVEVILKRRYALVVGKRVRLLVPTRRGREVYKFLTEERIEFRDLVSEERTRIVERYMDEVELGERDYYDVLNELFREALSKGILKERVIEAKG